MTGLLSPDYAFFLSYSRDNDDSYLRQFFVDLEKDVRLLKNRRWAGFMDQRQQIGQEWDETIEKALATSKTLVCLYSGDYFERESCGKEFQVFLNRRREYRRETNVRPGCIIPVLWAPCEVPRTLPRFLYSEEPGSLYETQGLQYITSLGDQTVAYRKLVRKFATLICQAADTYKLPPTRPQPTFSTIPNAFRPSLPMPDYNSPDATAGLDSSIFVFCEPGRTPPFAPPEEDAHPYVASSVAMGMEIDPHQFRFDPARPFMGELEDLAASKSIVVLVVDGALLGDAAARARLAELDAKLHDRAAATVLWRPNTRTPQLESYLQGTLSRLVKRRPPVFHQQVEGAGAFADAIRQSLDHLQTKLAGAVQPVARAAVRPTEYPALPQLQAPSGAAY